MKPHFFGPADARLYGIYNEPRVPDDGAPAVLICYPIAGEYMRAHRACRQLTNLLTRRGCPVMRFDYYGTGDSFGDVREATVDRWCGDIAEAVDELIALCGATRVKLVGLRFGATMALRAAETIEAVDQVVMWDPIIDGAAYVVELEGRHVDEQVGRGADTSTTGVIGVNGFPISKVIRDDIARIDARKSEPSRPFGVDVVVSSEQDVWKEMGEHVESALGRGRYVVSPSAGDWGEADEFGSALIPQQIISSVIDRLFADGEESS